MQYDLKVVLVSFMCKHEACSLHLNMDFSLQCASRKHEAAMKYYLHDYKVGTVVLIQMVPVPEKVKSLQHINPT